MALRAKKLQRGSVIGAACLMLAFAAAVAAGAGQHQPQKQLLRHPVFSTEAALPFKSGLILGGTLEDGRNALVALHRDGSLNRQFANHGVIRFRQDRGPLFDPEEFGSPIAVDRRGRILVALTHTVRRWLPDGRPDPSFGSAGTVRVHFGQPETEVTSVAVEPGGRILVGGGAYRCRCRGPVVARLTSQGEPDTSFGQDGSKLLSGDYGAEGPRVLAIAPGPRGEIFVVSGGQPEGPTIQRLYRRGGLDHSFGRGGSLVVGEGDRSGSGIFALPKIAVTPRGKLVVGSTLERHGGKYVMIAYRYLADGRPDRSLGRHGRAGLATSINAFTESVAARPDGEILLGGDGVGNRGRYFLLAGLRPNGKPDRTLGRGGFAKARVGPESEAAALVLRARSAIAIGYTTTGDSEVRRTQLARFPLSP